MRTVIFIVVVTSASWSQAGLIYLSQNRSVGAFAVVTPGEPADNESISAPDFSPFSAQVSAAGVLVNGGSAPSGTYSVAMSSTNSILVGNAITASGQSASGAAGGVTQPFARSGAKSLTDVSFTVDQTGNYFLSGVLHLLGSRFQPAGNGPPDPAHVAIALSGPGAGFSADLTIPITAVGQQDLSLPVSQAVLLTAGDVYELSVSATTDQFSTDRLGIALPPAKLNTFADYSITLAPVPEPSSVCLLASALVFLAAPLRRLRSRAVTTRSDS